MEWRVIGKAKDKSGNNEMAMDLSPGNAVSPGNAIKSTSRKSTHIKFLLPK